MNPQQSTTPPTVFRSVLHRARTLSLAALCLLGAARMAEAQTYSLSNAWSTAAASTCRSIGYSVVSNQVFVATTAPAISVFDGTAGTSIGSVGVSWLTAGTGTFKLDQIGVGDDGVLYGGTLQTSISSANQFKIFRWGSWNDTNQIISYAGDPLTGTSLDNSTKRVGDTMAVTGSGTNTLILCGISAQNSFVLFSTVDGTNFTPTVLTVSSGLVAAAGNLFGLSFYTNNTFLLKPESSQAGPNLYLIQYPTNFASLTSPVTATVLATNTVAASAGSTLPVISYAPAGGLMAMQTNAAGGPSGVYLYTLTNFSSTTNLLSSITYSCPTANGNLTEMIAMGGVGKTNWIYAMDTANTVQAYQIIFSAGALGPSFTAQPAGVSGAYPPQTLTVTESGTQPITNYWYSNTSSNSTGGTLVQSSTNTAYTITTAVTNYYYVIATNAGGGQTSSVVQVSLIPATTNAVVTSLFSIAPGTTNYPFVKNDDNTRGIGYDANTQRLAVANKASGANIFLVDGTTGTNLGSMNTTGMYVGGTFPIDQVGIADDGAVYAGNLAIAGQQFNLTYWPATTTNAVLYNAYGPGDPGANGLADRWGDNMAVRGAGVNTQILLSSRNTNMALLTTMDGSNFTATTIPVAGVPTGFAGNGIAFGAGNTFWAKSYLGDLYEVSFDPTLASNAAVVLDYVAAGNAQIPLHMVGVGVDSANGILGGVVLTDQNPDLQLFQLTGTANPPVLFNQSFFPSYNPSANGNDLGVVVMKYPRAYALDVDIGIIGVTYGVPVSTPPTINTQPVGGTVFAAPVPFSLSVGVSGTLPLNYKWQFNTVSNAATATAIPGATNGSYTLNSPVVTNTGWYDVIVTNFGGAITSAPVLLTVVQPVTSTYVTNVWKQAPTGSNSYLDSSSYNVRGLAYDTNTATVVLCNHATTSMTVLNAADGSLNNSITINTAGLPPGTFVLDQIAVADDGALYAGNLAITSLGDTFSITRYSAVSSSAGENASYTGDPGAGSGERWGDTMAIRGSGTSTQILIGSYGQGDGPGTNVVLFQTTDGQNFTPLLIGVANTPSGFAGLGIAFGAGNTFWAKGGHNYDLRQVSFDPTGATPAAVIQDYVASNQIPNDLTGLAVDAGNNILIGTCYNDTPNDLQFYQLTGTTNSPTLFDQAFYLTENANYQENAAAVIKFPWAFGLNANNGLVALKYAVPPAVLAPFSVAASEVAGTGFVLNWPSTVGHSYNVLSSTTVTTARSTWATNASYSGTGGTLSYTNASPTGARYYTIQGQ